jgi:hypothetical protein
VLQKELVGHRGIILGQLFINFISSRSDWCQGCDRGEGRERKGWQGMTLIYVRCIRPHQFQAQAGKAKAGKGKGQ